MKNAPNAEMANSIAMMIVNININFSGPRRVWPVPPRLSPPNAAPALASEC